MEAAGFPALLLSAGEPSPALGPTLRVVWDRVIPCLFLLHLTRESHTRGFCAGGLARGEASDSVESLMETTAHPPRRRHGVIPRPQLGPCPAPAARCPSSLAQPGLVTSSLTLPLPLTRHSKDLSKVLLSQVSRIPHPRLAAPQKYPLACRTYAFGSPVPPPTAHQRLQMLPRTLPRARPALPSQLLQVGLRNIE